MNNNKIYAVVGLAGVGKSQVVDRLSKNLGGAVVYFGGIVLTEMERRGLSSNPENERVVREALRDEHGMAAMAVIGEKLIRQHSDRGECVVVDGLYSDEELTVLRKSFGKDLEILSVHANKAIRAERLRVRKNRPLTYEQMLERDEAEIDKLNKAKPIVVGDYHIVNNSTLDDLHQAIDSLPITNSLSSDE